MGWAGAVIGAAGSVAGAFIQKGAQEDAIKAQEKALKRQEARLESIDPNELAARATVQDIAKRANELLAQRQVDPALAAIRRVGAEGVLREAQQGPGAGDLVAEQLFQETRTQDPKLAALKQQLLDSAKAELDAGAQLPPDFQAELVRTGLERGGMTGFGARGQGATGVEIRKLIGSGGIQLKQQRQQQAMALAGAAQDIENARVNILAGIFPKLKDLQTANLARQQGVLAIGESTVPKVGITGEDVVNIGLTKLGTQNQLTGQRGDLGATGALAQGAFLNQLIGAGTSLATSTIGARETAAQKDARLAQKHGIV